MTDATGSDDKRGAKEFRDSQWRRKHPLTWVQQAIDVLGVCFTILILIAVVDEVVSRYVLDNATPWTGPGAGVALAWLVFLGASSAVWTNTNLGTTYLRTRLRSKRLRIGLESLQQVLTAGFGVVTAWSGYLLASANTRAVVQGLNLSVPVVYSITIIFGVLASVFAIVRLFGLFIGRSGEDQC